MLDRLEQIADLDLQCSLMSVSPAAAADTEPDGSATLDLCVDPDWADAHVRFHIVRFLDRGNLGEVFLARDSKLHRIVALKRIKQAPAADHDKRARFVVEAEITGRLEHPGIVPVYGLGTYDDGRPFYAMRFIRGDSLKEAIDAFHEADAARPRPRPAVAGAAELLRRFLDVCNAIAYAHSRGMMHRDLKPGNIMLGQYGETLVVDWGLAKAWAGRGRAGVGDGDGRWSRLGQRPARDASRDRAGHAGVHEPGAGGRPDRPARPGQRRLQPGRHALLPADRQAAVRRQDMASVLRRSQRGDFPPPRQARSGSTRRWRRSA